MRRLALSLTALLVLAACGGAPRNPPAAEAPLPKAAPVKPVTGDVAIAPAKPDIPVDDDPQQFMGLDQDGVSEIIGAPDLIRRDGPAEVWVYRGEGCFLDVFLYRQEADDKFEVRYVDLRAPDLAEDKHRPCLADIIREAAERPVKG